MASQVEVGGRGASTVLERQLFWSVNCRELQLSGASIAFKGMAFLILILTDINYYQIIIKGLIIKGLMIIIIIIKGFGGVI